MPAPRLLVAPLVLALGSVTTLLAARNEPQPLSLPAAQATVHSIAAPPTNPPLQFRPIPTMEKPTINRAAPTVYSIGDPTDEEQLYVELINRARSNPTAEGERLVTTQDEDVLRALEFFNVDVDLVRSQFHSITAAPPVSIHPALITAARRHSADMLEHAFQGHVGADGSTSQSRVNDTGYLWTALGENVYASAYSVWYGHAGFNIDWGPGPGGIQTPPGHRITIHNRIFREVGVGVIHGTNTGVGPQLVTQVFATRQGQTPLVTGVAYYDFNTNSFYDLGEGIGGITVRVSGTLTYAVTARSGGYSVPVNGNGSYTVTFQLPGFGDVQKTASITNSENVKVDYTPTYSAPVIGGTTLAYVGHDNEFTFAPVGAATSYEWQSSRLLGWTNALGAEAGLEEFTTETSDGYQVRSTSIRHQGSASYRLAHPEPPTDQRLTLTRPVRLGASSQLSFWSRLGTSEEGEVARVEVSADDGGTWLQTWSQQATGDPGEATFTERQVALDAFAGKVVKLRFTYAFTSGSYFPPFIDRVGWYIDDIRVTDAEFLEEADPQATSPGQVFQFRPIAVGSYLLRVRPHIGDRLLPWGPGLAVIAEIGDPPQVSLTLEAIEKVSSDWVFTLVVEGTPANPLGIQRSASVVGPWQDAPEASIEPLEGSGRFRVTIPVAAQASASGFFRAVSVANGE